MRTLWNCINICFVIALTINAAEYPESIKANLVSEGSGVKIVNEDDLFQRIEWNCDTSIDFVCENPHHTSEDIVEYNLTEQTITLSFWGKRFEEFMGMSETGNFTYSLTDIQIATNDAILGYSISEKKVKYIDSPLLLNPVGNDWWPHHWHYFGDDNPPTFRVYIDLTKKWRFDQKYDMPTNIQLAKVRFLFEDERGQEHEIEKACTDGETEIIIEIYDLPEGTLKSDIAFSQLPADKSEGQLIGDVEIINNGTVARQIYKVPDEFDRSLNTNKTRDIDFKISIPTGILKESITLLRPPVVLFHGLWDNPSMWGKMLGYLIESGFQGDHVFSPPLYNAYSFNVNIFHVQSWIDKIICSDIRKGIACKKVDIVAHSMGGCVSKLAAVQNPKHFRKIITIGTPHRGSPLADIAWLVAQNPDLSDVHAFLALWKHPITLGAIEDLQTTKPPIPADIAGVDCLEVVGNSILVGSESNYDLIVLINLLYYLMNPSFLPPFPVVHDAIFGEPSDLVVGNSSQCGGGTNCISLPVLSHLHEGNNESFIQMAIQYLNGIQVSYNAGKINMLSTQFAIQSPQFFERENKINNVNGTISIISPPNGSTIQNDATMRCQIEGSGDTDTAVVILSGGNGEFCYSLPCEVLLDVPADIHGNVTLAVLGLNSQTGTTTDLDTITLNIDNNSILESMILGIPNPLHLDNFYTQEIQNLFHISIIGQFSDGSFADISASSTGTTYASSDPVVVEVDPDGILIPKVEGEAKIEIRNGNLVKTLDIFVNEIDLSVNNWKLH